MSSNKFQKRLCILALLSIPALVSGCISAAYFYRFYSLGHAPFGMIISSIILPTFLWSLIFVTSIFAWRRKWHWYVFVPLLTTYPWMYNNFIALLFSVNISGEWYWITTIELWTKAAFYLAALVSSFYFIINKLMIRNN